MCLAAAVRHRALQQPGKPAAHASRRAWQARSLGGLAPLASVTVTFEDRVHAFLGWSTVELQQFRRAVSEETIDAALAQLGEIHRVIHGVGVNDHAAIMGHLVHPGLDQIHVTLLAAALEC